MFLFVVLLLSLFPPMTSDIHIPALPLIMTSLHATSGQVKLITGLYALGYAFGQLGFGPASDRFGRKPILIVGLIAYLATTLACAMATTINMLLVMRLIQGMAACCGPNIAYSMIRDKYEGIQCTKYIAYCATAVGIAVVIAPILGSFLITFGHWQTPFYFLFILVLIALALVLVFVRETNLNLDLAGLNIKNLLHNYASVLSHKPYLLMNLTVAFIFSGYYGYLTDSSLILINQMGASVHVFGVILALSAGTYAATSFSSSKLTAKVSPKKLIAIGSATCLVAGIVMAALLFAKYYTIYSVVIPVLFFVFGIALVRSMAISTALQHLQENIGIGSTLLGSSQYLFAAIASLVLSKLPVAYGLPLSILLCIVSALGIISYALYSANAKMRS